METDNNKNQEIIVEVSYKYLEGKNGIYFINENEEVGSGAQGIIYRCYEQDRPYYKLCAKKILRAQKSQDVLYTVLQNEIGCYQKILKQNNNPLQRFAIKAYDIIETNNSEFMPDQQFTLLDLFNKRKFFIDIEIKMFMKQILNGLKFLHQQGVVHRDLKPENVFIDSYIQLKIGDYGHAKFQMKRDTAYKTGTNLYNAPEVLFRYDATEKSDIFALGIIMYLMVYETTPETYNYLVAQKELFVNDQNEQTIQQPTNLYVNEKFVELLSKILQKNPLQRPSLEQIEQILDQVEDSFQIFDNMSKFQGFVSMTKQSWDIQTLINQQNSQEVYLASLSQILFKYEDQGMILEGSKSTVITDKKLKDQKVQDILNKLQDYKYNLSLIQNYLEDNQFSLQLNKFLRFTANNLIRLIEYNSNSQTFCQLINQCQVPELILYLISSANQSDINLVELINQQQLSIKENCIRYHIEFNNRLNKLITNELQSEINSNDQLYKQYQQKFKWLNLQYQFDQNILWEGIKELIIRLLKILCQYYYNQDLDINQRLVIAMCIYCLTLSSDYENGQHFKSLDYNKNPFVYFMDVYSTLQKFCRNQQNPDQVIISFIQQLLQTETFYDLNNYLNN